VLLGLVCSGFVPHAGAADYPTRAIRIVTAFGSGSASDIVARRVAEQLQHRLGQAVVVENRPGASGQLAANQVARAQPDGYTLMFATNTTHASNPWLFKNLRYDPVKDFTPLAQVARFPFVLAVSGKLPIRDVNTLLQYAAANPDQRNYAYGNSTGQIAAASFDRLTGMQATAIPYKSTPQAMTDVIGGRALFMFVDWTSSATQIQAGNLVALAVSSEKRSALLPDIPSVTEALALPDFDLVAYAGLFAPAGIPPDIAEKLSTALYAIVSAPDFQQQLRSMGAEPAPANAQAFGVFVGQQLRLWGEKVRQAGIQPE